jgi:proteasome lid subunit RPN8/RPN11
MSKDIRMYGHTTALVEKPKDLSVEKEDLVLNKIPFGIIENAIWFFRIIFFKQRTECALLITYDADNDEYDLEVPEQEVVYSNVKWKNEGDIDNVVGTIHSHCDFNGSFSGTDIDDNKKTPGLHIVIGNIDDSPSMDIEITLNKEMVIKDIEPEEIVENWDKYKDLLDCPSFITDKNIKLCDKEFSYGYQGDYKNNYKPYSGYQGYKNDDYREERHKKKTTAINNPWGYDDQHGEKDSKEPETEEDYKNWSYK